MDDPTKKTGVLAMQLSEERRRSEIILARVMLPAVDRVLSGDALGLKGASDLIREVCDSYTELLDEWNAL